MGALPLNAITLLHHHAKARVTPLRPGQHHGVTSPCPYPLSSVLRHTTRSHYHTQGCCYTVSHVLSHGHTTGSLHPALNHITGSLHSAPVSPPLHWVTPPRVTPTRSWCGGLLLPYKVLRHQKVLSLLLLSSLHHGQAGSGKAGKKASIQAGRQIGR